MLLSIVFVGVFVFPELTYYIMTNIEGQPERRNIIVTSLAVIVYFLADGHFYGGLKIAIVNIKFYDETALVIFFWVMFLWFGLRYWQVNHALAAQEVSTEVQQSIHSKANRYIVCKIANLPEKIYVKRQFSFNVHTQHNDWSILNGRNNKTYVFSKKEKSIVKTLLYSYYAIYGDSINKYITPYVLFCFALFMGINHFFSGSTITLFSLFSLATIEFLYGIKD